LTKAEDINNSRPGGLDEMTQNRTGFGGEAQCQGRGEWIFLSPALTPPNRAKRGSVRRESDFQSCFDSVKTKNNVENPCN
jgi:hypothetical protein